MPGTAVYRWPVSGYLITALSAVATVTAPSPPHSTPQRDARIRTVNWKHTVHWNRDWQCDVTIQPLLPRGKHHAFQQSQKLSVWLSAIAVVSDSADYRPVRYSNSTIVLTLHTHTHPFNGPLSGTTRVSRYQKGQSGFYWSKRQWVAVASARPYASLHLAPDR